MGVWVSVGAKGMGVDRAVMSAGKKEFGGSGVKFVLVEGGDGLYWAI
jgi:hypothetical protein